MEVVLSSGEIDIVIVAVPSEVAQSVVDRVVAAGVRGILNFAPTKLNVPSGVALKNVNMAMELEALSYALANSEKRPRKAAAARGVNAAG
jgi:redox-sensing transcriptional repressor